MNCNPHKLATSIEEALSHVKVPGYDVDVVSSGVIKLIKVSNDCKKAVIYIDFLSSQPHCIFCRFINQTLWSRIVELIRDAVMKLGLELVEVIDYRLP